MFLNQLLYTTKPFCFKKRPVVDLVSGSLVNPVFRFYAGWVLFVPAFNAPLLVLLFILGIQFGGFGLYRMSSRGHEKKLGLKSSVVMFGEKNLKALAYVALAIGAISYVLAALTVLPITYLYWGLAMLLFAPLYRTALTKPEEINMKKMYWLVYLQYTVFIAGFIALYLLGAA
jgi:4-hydroxybenzoate polyprenyltransferase